MEADIRDTLEQSKAKISPVVSSQACADAEPVHSGLSSSTTVPFVAATASSSCIRSIPSELVDDQAAALVESPIVTGPDKATTSDMMDADPTSMMFSPISVSSVLTTLITSCFTTDLVAGYSSLR